MAVKGSILHLVDPATEPEIAALEREFVRGVAKFVTNDEVHPLKHWGPHSLRVARHVYLIAMCMGAEKGFARRCMCAAFLHDWGKLHESMYELFHHKRKFTDEERTQAQLHDLRGVEMMSRVLQGRFGYDDGTLREIKLGQLTHHQPYNRPLSPELFAEAYSGLPYETKLGKSLPFIGRLLKVADFYDASMDHDRTYKRPLSQREACLYLLRNAGREFDPDIVHAFVHRVLKKDYWFEGWQVSFCYYEINLRNLWHTIQKKVRKNRAG